MNQARRRCGPGRWAAGLLGLGLQLAQAAAPALPATDDSPAGMNCYELSTVASMRWERPGGDWADAAGQAYGGRPFDSLTVRRSADPQALRWDASELVRHWGTEGAWPGALVLRGDEAGPRGTVELVSREGAQVARRPLLEIEWADGHTEFLEAMADSALSCPQHRTVGQLPVLKIEAGRQAVLLFDRRGARPAAVKRATLRAWSLRQTGRGSAIGLFAGRLPGGRAEPGPAGLAALFPGDRGLEKHPEVWLVERFDQPNVLPSWLGADAQDRVAQVGGLRAGPGYSAHAGGALRVSIPKGQFRGLDSPIALKPLVPGGEPVAAFMRYYLRLGDDWDPTLDGGKLPGFAGTYGSAGWGGRRSNGSNGWSARGGFARAPAPGTLLAQARGVGSYVYHADMQGRYGETWGWNLGAAGWLEKGRWYSIEQELRLNTPGLSDGLLRVWVDGRKAFERTNLRFRDVDTLRIESAWLNVYHGGSRPSPETMTLYIDSLVIAGRYIGPMVGGRP